MTPGKNEEFCKPSEISKTIATEEGRRDEDYRSRVL